MEQDFRYIDFGRSENVRGKSIPNNKVRLHYLSKEQGAKNPSYSIALNNHLSQELKDGGYKFMRVRENMLTGELYLVFVQDKTNDSIPVAFGRGDGKCASVNGRAFIEYIINALHIDKSNANNLLLDIGINKSRIKEAIVFQLSNI